MDTSNRLTDADFSSEPTTAVTDAGIDESNYGGYPDPDWSSPAASLAPEALSESGTGDDDEFAVAPDEATADLPVDDEPEPGEADAEDTAEAEPELTPRERKLAAERDEAKARAEALELEHQNQQLAQIDQFADEAYQHIQGKFQHDLADATARAATLQGAARTTYLNQRTAQITQERDQNLGYLNQQYGQHKTAILYNHAPTMREFRLAVIQEHGLPKESLAELEQVHPSQIDAILPGLKTKYQTLSAKDQKIRQLQRDLAAAKRIASGADTMGGAPAAGVGVKPKGPLTSEEDAAAAYYSMGGWQRS